MPVLLSSGGSLMGFSGSRFSLHYQTPMLKVGIYLFPDSLELFSQLDEISEHPLTDFIEAGIFADVNDRPQQISVCFLNSSPRYVRKGFDLASNQDQCLFQFPSHEGELVASSRKNPIQHFIYLYDERVRYQAVSLI
jgi:hypothetical protein